MFISGDWRPANSHARYAWVSPLRVENSRSGSRLRANFSRLIEKCELLSPFLTQFPNNVNSDPCKKRKPCVKWINDNTFLTMSDFWSEEHWERASVYTGPKTSEDFGLLRKTSDFLGRLRNSSGIYGNDRVVFKNSCTPRINWNLTLISQTKLARCLFASSIYKHILL